MARNPLIRLSEEGQSVWLDNLTRPMIERGTLARLVAEDGVTGVTSNPSIFRAAMTEGDAYDSQIQELAAKGRTAPQIYEEMAVRDIRRAADVLRSVYDRTRGTDGFVSLEVSPHLARDAKGTLEEASRLWQAVDRPNVLIKIPGTDEGIPAIEACLSRGINVNITLLFSLDAYRKVILAFFRAMDTRFENAEPVGAVATVASFFLSRIDVKVDKLLAARAEKRGDEAETAQSLLGRTAIANAKLAYQLWKEMHAGGRFKRLKAAGAHVQKPLWASTSTKNPDESDVKYVEALIGPSTINTMPDETLEAFRDHGRVAATVERDVEGARGVMEGLASVGIDIDQVTAELVEEGIEKFVKPFDALIAALEEKRQTLAGRA